MDILLEEFYKTDIYLEKYHDRKIFLDEQSYQINGIAKSGKTKLIKSYLSSLKKNSYLYINCNDIRIDIELLNDSLQAFCSVNKIDTLVLDNYNPSISIVNVSQLIVACENHYDISYLTTITLYPLDYEEFLAYEQKFDSSALNHYLQLGGFPEMHKIVPDERINYLQTLLQYSLEEMEFDILCYCAKSIALKLSPFTIYERLKNNRKISKDKLYKTYDSLVSKNYIHPLEKFEHQRATKKIYLCDISLSNALSTQKNFGRLFENMVFLELLKSGTTCYYDDNIDFYIPQRSEIILCKPFADERVLFKKIETLEAFIFTHQVKKITAITMSKEINLSHPFSKVSMIPFDIWALGD